MFSHVQPNSTHAQMKLQVLAFGLRGPVAHQGNLPAHGLGVGDPRYRLLVEYYSVKVHKVNLLMTFSYILRSVIISVMGKDASYDTMEERQYRNDQKNICGKQNEII